MKTITIYLLVTLNFLFQEITFAQISQHPIDYSNTREGESVEFCLTHKKKTQLLSSLVEIQNDSLNTIEFEKALQKVKNGTEKNTIYKIPVVFHVLHQNGAENITENQILDALSILNRDFRKLNSDASEVVSDFQGLTADVEIEFVLATKAPNGDCFSGITRTQNSLTYSGDDGNAQLEIIKANNDVYQGEWSGSMYLNIFICEDIGGAAGYTYNPNSSSMGNGIWVKSTYVGSIGTSSELHSRVLTHEVGHWLNLDHTWGDGNNPGISNCTADDNVEDTPVTIGSTSCLLAANTCDDVNSFFSTWQYDVVDNVENYMDYSYCSKMFTNGQKSRMRAALISSVGGRSNLLTQNNLLATGTNDEPAVLCKADFIADKLVICTGESVTFTDLSYSIADSWLWTISGGTPSSSNIQNPVSMFSTPGEYSVTLAASGGGSNNSETKMQYITVLPSGTSLPYYEGFEGYTTLDESDNWFLYDANDDRHFEIAENTGYSGVKCVQLSNFDETAETVDELISSTIDLSTVNSADNVTLSFRYAYRKSTSSDSESLKVLATSDCGDTWSTRKTISGSTLSSNIVTTDWTPTSVDDWTTVHITSITSSYYVSNFRFKFQFNASGGNNLYLDDINLYAGEPSDQLILDINEYVGGIAEMKLYPNPVDNELNLFFNLQSNKEIQISIHDISGKIENEYLIKGNQGANSVIINTEKLAAGFYNVRVSSNDSVKVIQLIVK